MTGWDTLPDDLARLVGSAPGRLGVSVRRHDGRRVDLDADHVVPAASTIKVAVLVATLRACQEGRLGLDAPVPLPPAAARVGGSGPLALLPSVVRLPLVEALAMMTCLSDNDATNAVVDLVGSAAVEAALARVPTRHTHLRRRFMDLEAAARGVDNTTSAADLVDVLVALREGRLLDAARTRTALDLLRGQQSRDGLPAYLPSTVLVANKTGELPGVRHDHALVEPAPGRWAAVAVVATGLSVAPDRERGTAVLSVFARVGELVHDALVAGVSVDTTERSGLTERSVPLVESRHDRETRTS